MDLFTNHVDLLIDLMEVYILNIFMDQLVDPMESMCKLYIRTYGPYGPYYIPITLWTKIILYRPYGLICKP
jgi:hypothetical protein